MTASENYQYALCPIHHKPVWGGNLKCDDCRAEAEQVVRASQDVKWKMRIYVITGKDCGHCLITACGGYGTDYKKCRLNKLAEEGVG